MPEIIIGSRLSTPIGELLLLSNGDALTGVYMTPHPFKPGRLDDALLRPARDQLRAYFAGELRDFDVPCAGAGSTFQTQVWEALCSIPFGCTVSYGEIARRVGLPKASRAVGAANGHNPISIVVPCHRVIGADGKLTGYGGGLNRKRWLLRHEKKVLAHSAILERHGHR
jgi:methylated-DNA-[protein]-cysteine S-methyltransferase